MVAPHLVLAAAFAFGEPNDALLHASAGALGPRPRSPDLTLHVMQSGPRGTAAPFGIEDPSARGPRAGRPVCSGDVCQPAVSLPGVEPTYDRAAAREALVLAIVSRVRVEPLTSWVWAVIASGLTLEYRPPVWDGANAGAHGWGSVVLRLRLRLDAHNAPVFPERPR